MQQGNCGQLQQVCVCPVRLTCQPHQICIKSLSHTHTHTHSPGRANAVAGHLTIVAKKLMIALDNAPGRNADTDHASGALLSLQEQRIANLLGNAWKQSEKNKKTKIYSYNGSKSGPKQWPKVNKFPALPTILPNTLTLTFTLVSLVFLSCLSSFILSLSLYSILYYTSCEGQCGRMCLKFNNRPSTKQRRQKGQTFVKKNFRGIKTN